MNILKNKVFIFVLLLIVVTIGYFLGIVPPHTPSETSSGKSIATPLEPKKLTVGFIPITDAAQVIVGSNLKEFERRGLEVELVPLRGGALILQALSSGDVDIAFSNLASVVYYQENVGPLFTLSGGTLMNKKYSEAGLVIRNNDEDLKNSKFENKTIAVNTRGNIIELALLKFLSNNGTNRNSVSFIELPFKDMELALRSGKIDAAPLPEPLLTKSLNTEGLYNLGDYFVLAYGEMYGTGYFTTPQLFNDKKEQFLLFNEVIKEITPRINEFNDVIIGAISKTTKVPEPLLTDAGRAWFVDTLPDTAISDMKNKMQSAGWLKNK
ncbi:MAG: ABC transporter substrate-binding protein [Gammaproteobacteria bacterium]|nr:ABC transporter substrate-binding protein [Gammaproteobacteria bacterium]